MAILRVSGQATSWPSFAAGDWIVVTDTDGDNHLLLAITASGATPEIVVEIPFSRHIRG